MHNNFQLKILKTEKVVNFFAKKVIFTYFSTGGSQNVERKKSRMAVMP